MNTEWNDLTNRHPQKGSWIEATKREVSLPICVWQMFCLHFQLRAFILVQQVDCTCMFKRFDFHDHLCRLVFVRVCEIVSSRIPRVHVYVCVHAVQQMYWLQQVSLWSECIIQAVCRCSLWHHVSRLSFFSPSCTLTALMLLTWRNQNLAIQCSAQQNSFFFHAFSTSTLPSQGIFFFQNSAGK